MAATSSAAYVYASNAFNVAYTLPFSTTHIYWGSKVWTLLLSVRKYSWGILPLWFNCLFQSILIICCGGIILARLYSGSFVILLGFKIGFLPGFTLIFVWMLTWGSGQYLSSPTNLGLAGSCSDYLFIGSNWSGWPDGGLMLFCRRSDSLIVDNVELSVKLYVPWS